MITFRISDGLGNQLFQYAAALALARRLDADLCFSLDYFQSAKTRTDRPFLLERLIGQTLPRANRSRVLAMRALQQLRSRVAPDSALHVPGLAYLYYGPAYLPSFEAIRDGTFVAGYFQSPAYFPDALGGSAQIAQAARPQQSVARQRLDQIAAGTRRAAIHIRRGDYAAIANGAMVLPPERIRAAVGRLPEDTALIVFSDEASYAAALDLGRPFTLFRSEVGDPLEEFLAMSACDDFVIANSTFSWWASRLGAAADKRILAPADWFGPSRSAGTEAIYAAGQELY